MWLLGSIVALPTLGGNIPSSSESATSAATILVGLALMVGALAYGTIHYLRDWAREINRRQGNLGAARTRRRRGPFNPFLNSATVSGIFFPGREAFGSASPSE